MPDPLQRGPAVRRVPLLPGPRRRRAQATGGEQPVGDRPCHRPRAIRRGEAGEQRIGGRGAQPDPDHPRLPVIIAIARLARRPEPALDRRAPSFRPAVEIARAGCIGRRFAGGSDRPLLPIEQRVQIDGHDRGRADRLQRAAIAQPARRIIPAAFGPCAQVAVHLRRRPPACLCGQHILAVAFVARGVAVVIVAVEHRAVGHPHHACGCRGFCRQRGGTAHPIGMLRPQRRQPPTQHRRRALLGQAHHQVQERRLRPADIIGPCTVGDMAVPLDQRHEIVDHPVDQVRAPVRLQAQHREIAVPIIGLAKPAARHHVRRGQRQRRRSGRGAERRPGEVVPQAGDMRRHRRPGRLGRHRRSLFGHVEMREDEAFQRSVVRRLLAPIRRQDRRRRPLRHRIDEGLPVGKDPPHLHVVEQRSVQVGGRPHRPYRRFACARPRRNQQ